MIGMDGKEMSAGEALDNLAESYLDSPELVELAGCVEINLENIRSLAEQHPLVGIAWGQAMGLCRRIIAADEAADD